ncbi:MAG: hypothetical protein KDD85_12740 [Parvularculaceae bacterium]|nr:hypothetical protein [Parvularculaceae bacterium]
MTETGSGPRKLPARFYKDVACVEGDGAYAIELDGRTAKTRAGNRLAVHSRPFALAIAQEWEAQTQTIDMSSMAMTKFAMTIADLGARDAPAWREATLSFLKSDLVCYRAVEPASLAERQARIWDPLLDWADEMLGIRLNTGAGVLFIEQPAKSLDAAKCVIDAQSPARALGVKTAAEIAGSAIIAFALLKNAFPAADLFAASRVDEDFQAERWGLDREAAARAAQLKEDFNNAARFLSLV